MQTTRIDWPTPNRDKIRFRIYVNYVLNRNCEVKLDVLNDGGTLLNETFDQFRQAAQRVADNDWSDNPTQICDTISDKPEKMVKCYSCASASGGPISG